MSNNEVIVQESLEAVGLGPQRIERAMNGATLFGAGGLLNSIELVQFIAALSDRTGLDAFDFMEGFNGTTSGVMASVDTLSAFLSRDQKQVLAG